MIAFFIEIGLHCEKCFIRNWQFFSSHSDYDYNYRRWPYFFSHLFVCIWCVCVCVRACRDQRSVLGTFCFFPPYFLGLGLLLNLEVISSSGLTGQWTSGICLFLCLGLCCWAQLWMECWELDLRFSCLHRRHFSDRTTFSALHFPLSDTTVAVNPVTTMYADHCV